MRLVACTAFAIGASRLTVRAQDTTEALTNAVKGSDLVFGSTGTVGSTIAEMPGRFEIAAGLRWVGATSLGSRDALLTGAAGSPFRLFSTSTELGAASEFHVHLAHRISRLVQGEIAASYVSVPLRTSIASDAENGAATVASESVMQLTVTGGGLVHLPRWRVGSRVLPFVTGGAGYLRQLHEGATLVQTGFTYYVGAGASIALSTADRRQRVKQIGLRLDTRAIVRAGGVTIDGRAYAAPAFGASLFARF
jgi:hypothetical protein